MSLIYFIQSGEAGPIKIGTVKSNVKGRLASFQTGSAEELRLLKVMLGGRIEERKLHLQFAEHRIRQRNEWFHPASEIMEFVEALPDDVSTEPVEVDTPKSQQPSPLRVLSSPPRDVGLSQEELSRRLWCGVENFVNLILDLREAQRDGRTDFEGTAIEFLDIATSGETFSPSMPTGSIAYELGKIIRAHNS